MYGCALRARAYLELAAELLNPGPHSWNSNDDSLGMEGASGGGHSGVAT
jgi:hypothetical protein